MRDGDNSPRKDEAEARQQDVYPHAKGAQQPQNLNVTVKSQPLQRHAMISNGGANAQMRALQPAASLRRPACRWEQRHRLSASGVPTTASVRLLSQGRLQRRYAVRTGNFVSYSSVRV